MLSIVRLACCAVVFGCSAQSLMGQNCKEIVYAHENQIDPPTIRISQIRGQGIDPSGTTVGHLCVGIFTEADHKLLKYVQADEDGRFHIDDLPPGEYRLIGEALGFCPANARIRVKSRVRSKKILIVHMNVDAIDSCSYVDTSKVESKSSPVADKRIQ